MKGTVLTKSYPAPEISIKEILRYAGARVPDDSISALLSDCIKEAENKLIYKVCYLELSATVSGDICDFKEFSIKSHALAKNLNGANRVILFAATVGLEIDRLIAKYSRLSPARAVMLDAFGCERIEALCDTFCADISAEYDAELKPRFSPGYGDLPLDTQVCIMSILEPQKNIGVFLTDSLMLTPSKSVTAFIAVKKG